MTERTVVVRVHEDVAASLKQVAALKGITPAQAMSEAWRLFMERHGDRLRAEAHRRADGIQ